MFNWIKNLFNKTPKQDVQTPPESYSKPRAPAPVKRQPPRPSAQPSYPYGTKPATRPVSSSSSAPSRATTVYEESESSIFTPLAVDHLSPHSPHRNSIWNAPTEIEPTRHPNYDPPVSSSDGDDSLRSNHTNSSHIDTSSSHSPSHHSSYDGGSSHSSSHSDTSSSWSDTSSSSTYDSGGGFDGGSSGGSSD